MIYHKQNRKPPRWLVAILLCFGCFLPGAPTQAADREVQEGEVIQIAKQKRLFFTLRVKQKGEFRIETTGENDTVCRLFDRWRGFFASDDNSGESKNCRFDTHLAAGDYRIEIQAKQGTLQQTKLHFLRYEASASEVLKSGIEQTTALKRLHFNTYRVEVPERRYIQIRSMGPTVFACRLFDANGWATGLQATAQNANVYTSQGYHRTCNLSGVLEAGIYQFTLYGDTSLPPPRGQSTQEADAFVSFGETFLPVAQFQTHTTPSHGIREFVFSLPETNSAPSVRILFVGQSDRRFALRLYAFDPLGNHRLISSCSMYRYRFQRSFHCRENTAIESGRRYLLVAAGSAQQSIGLGYHLFPAQKSAVSLGTTVAATTYAGITGAYEFQTLRSNEYFIEANNLGQSCLLQDTATHKILQARTLPLSANLHKQHALLQQGGLAEWFFLPYPGTIHIETHGDQDPICTIVGHKGDRIAQNDDSGEKRNCKIVSKLPAGLYKIEIHLTGNNTGSIAWSRRLIPDILPPNTQPHPDHSRIQQGPCRFQVALESGRYVLHTGDPGHVRAGSVAFHKASAPASARQAMTQPFQTRPFSTEAPEPTALSTLDLQTPTAFSLAHSEQRTFLWKVTRSGLYRIETQGLVRTDCTLQTPAEPKLFQEAQNGPGYNCLMIQYLPVGEYRLRVATQGASHGDIRLFAQSLSVKGHAARLTPEKRVYSLTRPSHGRYHRLRVYKTAQYTLQTFSHDELLICRLEATGNWPISSGKPCRWTGELEAGDYSLWIFPTRQDARYRAMIYQNDRVRFFWPLPDEAYGVQADTFDPYYTAPNADAPRTLQNATPSPTYRRYRPFRLFRRYDSETPSTATPSALSSHLRANVLQGQKSISLQAVELNRGPENSESVVTLPLFGLYHTNISPLGADAFEVKLPVEMTVEATLSKGFTGRLFAGKQFVAEIKNGKATFRAPAGTYRLAVQHNESKTGERYEIGLRVTESTPGTWLWREVPSTLQIRLHERARLDLQTEGDPDVWCTLARADNGKIISNNDNMSRDRWDCRLSELLPAGLYTLTLNGLGKGTWLSLKSRPSGQDQPFAQTKSTTVALQGEPIQGLLFQLQEITAVEIDTRSRKQLGCALENVQTQEVLGTSGGRRCNLFRLLGPGQYRWRVRSLYSQTHKAYARLKSLPATVITEGKPHTSRASRKDHAFVRFAIPQDGIYKLNVTGHPKAYCGLAPLGGVLRWVSCTDALSLQAGHYLGWLGVSAKGRHNLQIHLTEVPFVPNQRFAIQVPADQNKRFQISLAKEGFYQIEIRGEGNNRWGCQIGTQRGIWPPQRNDLRCHLLAYLKAGQHSLGLWRPRESAADTVRQGTLLIQPIDLSTPTTSDTVFSGETGTHTLAAKQSTQIRMPRWLGLQGHITLQGSGLALLTSPSDQGTQLIASCQSIGTTQSCLWSFPLPHSATLTLQAGDSPLQYAFTAHEIHSTPISLSPNTSHEWAASSSQPILRVPVHLPLAHTTLQALGRGLSCQLQLPQGRFMDGCKHTLHHLQGSATFVVHTSRFAGRIALVQHQQHHQARWNAPYATNTSSFSAFPALGRHATFQGTQAFFRYQADNTHVLTFRANGNALVCAIGEIGKPAFFSHSTSHGCTLSLPLNKGHYWIGLRTHHQTSASVRLLASTQPLVWQAEGRHGPYLLSQSSALWFGVRVPKASKIGLGLVAAHEKTRCVLYNRSMQPIARACMMYESLPAGEYWFKAHLSPSASASSASFEVRGLNPPPNAPPAEYLRQLTQQTP